LIEALLLLLLLLLPLPPLLMLLMLMLRRLLRLLLLLMLMLMLRRRLLLLLLLLLNPEQNNQGWFCKGNCTGGDNVFWTPRKVWDVYMTSVGVGSKNTLNAPPGTTGLIPPELVVRACDRSLFYWFVCVSTV
jgi:hypothetical protein